MNQLEEMENSRSVSNFLMDEIEFKRESIVSSGELGSWFKDRIKDVKVEESALKIRDEERVRDNTQSFV